MKEIILNNLTRLKILFIFIEIIAAIVVYSSFFEILVTEGSFRESLGQWFLIPLIILTLTQVFITGILIHVTLLTKTINNKIEKYDIFVITGLNTFLYSLIYAIFPITGPFHYITFTMQETPLSIMLTEILWTTFTVTTICFAIKKIYRVSWFYSFIFSGVSSILILAFAS